MVIFNQRMMRQKVLFLYMIFSTLFFLVNGTLSARNAPITTAGSSNGCPAGSVTVPLNVNGFTSVKAITLRLDYDPTQLVFVNYNNLNPSIASASVNTVSVSPTLTKVIIVWAEVNALTLPSNAKLLDLNFTLTTGSPQIIFNNTSGGGGECEYADENGVAMNDVPTATYYINSTITNIALGAAGAITGASVLCAGTNNVPYSVPVIANATGYIWTLPTGGTIISGNNTRSIVVNYSNSAVSGNVTVKGTNSCGQGTPSSLAVTVNPLPIPAITGNGTVCAGSTGNVYTTASGMTNYAWAVSSGGIISSGGGINDPTVTITWNTAGTQNVSVNFTNANGCTAATPTVKTVTVNPLPTPTITGNNTLCVGATGISYTTEPSMSAYAWAVSSGGQITSGAGTNAILVSWNTAGPQSVTVNYAITATGCSAATPTSKAITVNALPVPTISGPATVCAASTGNVYTTEAGMSGYLWTVSPGGIITGGGGTSDNSVTITWNAASPQSVSLNYTGTNGCTATSPTSKLVTVNALPVPTLSGAATVCAGSPGNVYSTEPGMTGYLWNVSAGGTISAGGGTTDNTITITWSTSGPQNVSVNYNSTAGCTALNPVVKNVTVNPLPAPTISGPATVCEASTGSYSTEAGMTGYLWTTSPGGTITSGSGTSNIVVSWNSAGAQSVNVNYTNENGCVAAVPAGKNVTVNPIPGAAGTITGSAHVCAGNNAVPYAVPAISNATSYSWNLPAGATIATGAGTSSITVNFSLSAVSGNITVTGNNTCGNGATSPVFPVVIDLMPAAAGTITGPDVVCAGTNGVNYSVPAIANATSYEWTVPAGALITSGATTSQIVVSFSATPGTGVVTVQGTSACGNGALSPVFTVAMIASQSAPVVSANGALLSSSTPDGNQWWYEGTGAIAGATGQTYSATITGWYWTVVEGVGCPFLESNHVYVLFIGQDELKNPGFNIYPVPSDGLFNIVMTTVTPEIYSIHVFNQLGMKIFELNDIPVNGTTEKQVDLRPIPPGIYSVVLRSRDHAIVRKMLIR
jgi:hypothetical protein